MVLTRYDDSDQSHLNDGREALPHISHEVTHSSLILNQTNPTAAEVCLRRNTSAAG